MYYLGEKHPPLPFFVILPALFKSLDPLFGLWQFPSELKALLTDKPTIGPILDPFKETNNSLISLSLDHVDDLIDGGCTQSNWYLGSKASRVWYN